MTSGSQQSEVRKSLEAELASLYEEYYDKIAHYASVHIGNKADAEDIAGEVFLKALESLRSYEHRGIPMQAWLFKIAHNLVVDYLRRMSKRKTVDLESVTIKSNENLEVVAEINIEIKRVKKAMEQLFNEKLVRDIPDIYGLQVADLAALDGWAEKSARNAVAAIKASRETTLAKILSGLGIRYVGEEVAGLLDEHYGGSLENLMQAGEEELLDIEGIGPQTAQSIKEYFHDPDVRNMLTQLMEFGFTIVSARKSSGESPFAGYVFLFTGSLAAMSRDEAKVRVKERGGKVASQVSKKVTHVVVGDKPGSKLKKARELGLNILTEKNFAGLLAGKFSNKNNQQLKIF
jgi:RNA polymerase sigma factor (sigma-70 family)